jgi:hypothetical protein
MKKLLLILMATTVSFVAFAQNVKSARQNKKAEKRKRIDALVKQEEEGVITYKKHSVYGIKLITDGYGGFFEIGRAQSIRKSLLFQLEIAERKHAKETKQSNPFAPTAPLIFGKQNYFYPVKLGVQQQFLFGNKGNKNGVAVTGNVGGGLIVGLLRPYMLEVDKAGQKVFVQYDSPDSLLFVNGPFYGGPNFGTGWNKLKITPGAYIKPAIRFDYGRYNELVSAVEVGMCAEFYAKKIPQLIRTKQKNFFFSGYVSIILGKRK